MRWCGVVCLMFTKAHTQNSAYSWLFDDRHQGNVLAIAHIRMLHTENKIISNIKRK